MTCEAEKSGARGRAGFVFETSGWFFQSMNFEVFKLIAPE
jgi:hypothetical protein